MKSRRLPALAAGALIASVAAAVTAPTAVPASAAPGDVTASVPSPISMPAGCFDLPISYTDEIPADTTTWDVLFRVEAPDGTYKTYLISEDTYPTSGTVSISMCQPTKVTGTYVVGVSGQVTTAAGQTSIEPHAVTTFDNFVPAVTRTTLGAKHKGRGKRERVRLKSALLSSYDGVTYTPVSAGNPVVFQRLRKGVWKEIRSAVTNERGVARISFKPHRRVKVRAVYGGYGYAVGGGPQPVAGSVSRTVTVKRV